MALRRRLGATSSSPDACSVEGPFIGGLAETRTDVGCGRQASNGILCPRSIAAGVVVAVVAVDMHAFWAEGTNYGVAFIESDGGHELVRAAGVPRRVLPRSKVLAARAPAASR